MKLNRLLVLAFFCLGSNFSFSQARLAITDLTNFPIASQDTAYDIQSYDSILITIKNVGNQPVIDGYDVLLHGNPGLTDTIYTDTSSTIFLGPGDSLTVRPASYQFDITHYDDGDNIVVVWPAARTTGVSVDTLTIHVYFVRLSGIDEPASRIIRAFPNPSRQYIQLETGPENDLRYVRIIDFKGEIVYSNTSYKGYIDLSLLNPGIYLVELGKKDGHSLFAKIIKE